MSKTVSQQIKFQNASAKDLFDLYMNEKKHSAATGAPAKIKLKNGEKFSAHGGYVKGKNLQIIKDKLIVQTWRGKDWAKNEPDSILIIGLEEDGKDTLLNMVHTNLSEKNAAHIDKGWTDNYWEPWKKYLKGEKVTAKKM